MNYYPKRPVKSFQDLEVYQKLLAISVAIAKRVIASDSLSLRGSDSDRGNPVGNEIASSSTTAVGTPRNDIDIPRKLVEVALELPVKIAAAHSLRFGNSEQAIRILEEIMIGCNKIVVYLELYRDLYNDNKIEIEFFEEKIKIILSTRFKILHLQRSWIKFTPLAIKTDKSYGKTK